MILNEAAAWYRDCRLDKLNQTILEDTLLENGYFAEANVLPPIFEPKKRQGSIDVANREPIVLHVPKGKNEWRDFTLLHPENYGKIVQIYLDNLTLIIDHLKRNSSIVSYSPPLAFETPGQRAGLQISGWTEMQRQMIEASGLNKMSTIVQIDIQRCYHTLYTHTLEWALKDIGDVNIGDELDIAIRRGNRNRTHGLAVGPYASDIAAEIVLTKVDSIVEEDCASIDSLGFRFKDNYYFLCKNDSDGEKIIASVAATLREYHLTLNDSKSKIMNFTDYMFSMWQIEHDFIGETVGIKEKKLTNTQLKLYLSKSILLSKSLNNEKNVIEKTIGKIMECELVGYIDYKWLFYTLSNSLYLRSLSYPKLINYMKKLAYEAPFTLGKEYKLFIETEVESATASKDLYRLFWLGYIAKDLEDDSIKKQLKESLLQFDQHSFTIALIKYIDDEEIEDMWGAHDGRVLLTKKPYLSHELLNEYLAISFAES